MTTASANGKIITVALEAGAIPESSEAAPIEWESCTERWQRFDAACNR